MARYRGPTDRLCRRENMNLFIKGERAYSDKAGIYRKGYPPGQHGPNRRVKLSDYGVQLREKQKVRRMYGVMERQFRKYFHLAEKMKGVTGENLLLLLERRMDNMVFRMGFATSRSEARQLVNHGHFTVNGKKVNIASYLLNLGDVVQVREKSRKMARILHAVETVDNRGKASWLELESKELKAEVKDFPGREDLTIPIQENLIVEYYSR